MDAVVKLSFDILAFSSIMVLVVLGLTVIVSMMGIFNLGHGELVLMGAYMVPCGLRDGLPISMMLIGKAYDEPTIFRVAYAFEQAGDWTEL